jgi:glycosyltransferase involved in cell wall biosynthesis
MIYLDVTSAAASRMSTGVQRAIRGIHTCLKDHDFAPVTWDRRGRCYASLSGLERMRLESPFANGFRKSFWPDVQEQFFSLGGIRDGFGKKERRIPMHGFPGEGHLLLIPDLCWDSRVGSWEKLTAQPGRKVAIFHDAMPLRLPGQSSSRDALFADYVRGLGLMDLVICVSREVEQDLLGYWKEFRVPPKPTKVIPWPMPFEGDRPDSSPPQGTPRILYVSRLRLRKNHLILLKACEMLWQEGHDFCLDLIGIADAPADTWKILRQIRRLGREGRPVRWLRHVSDAELSEAYSNCAFTVFPSRMEGFGLPILESLWHGHPVICGSNGALGEVSAGGGCLHVDQNDPGDLARGIKMLLDDQDVYSRLQAESRERRFRTWGDYSADLLASIAEVSR